MAPALPVNVELTADAGAWGQPDGWRRAARVNNRSRFIRFCSAFRFLFFISGGIRRPPHFYFNRKFGYYDFVLMLVFILNGLR